MLYHIIRVIIYAFMISYSMLMHIGSPKRIILLEFEAEEEENQEAPQQVAPEGEEQAPENYRSTPIIGLPPF